MNKKKGMSQTLALIVTATVLLMAALAVIFLTSNTIGDFGKSSRGQGCIQTVETQCEVKGGQGEVDLPGSCKTDGTETDSVPDSWSISGGEVSCTSVVN